MKYYNVQSGCMGYVEGYGYMLFASETDYKDYISEEDENV